MANFEKSYRKTIGNEGGYAHNPNDKGGETYTGIARNYWSKWEGWQGVDAAKKRMAPMPRYGTSDYRMWVTHFDDLLSSAPLLQKAVADFYRKNFWDANRLGEIVNQDVADWIFDHAVNGGSRGVKWAQEAACVVADGQIGPKSIAAINAADPHYLLKRCKDIAGAFRLKRVAEDPTQRQFLKGWLRRDGFTESEIKEMME